ncbi:MAG TPA: hypothetical protein VFH33_06215, partial [Candidatus Krumholzibacteria bacterium]|nr:hypothetical protein [Candidatus Krumholzibacteria bacterium]
ARTPCTVAQRLPYKKAKWLQSVLKELGGEVRLEEFVEPVKVPEPSARTPNDAKQEAINQNVHSERRTSSGGILCSHCGWEEEADARFCSLCLRRFNKTDKIDLRALEHKDNPVENPLSLPEAPDTHVAEALAWFRNVPPVVLIIGSGALLLVVVIVFIAR